MTAAQAQPVRGMGYGNVVYWNLGSARLTGKVFERQAGLPGNRSVIAEAVFSTRNSQ